MQDKKATQPQDESEQQQQIGELTADLQRIQADFVNYRRRMQEEREQVMDAAKAATVLKLLPVIDNIERAVGHVPAELADNPWAKGVVSLAKNLDKSLLDLGVTRIVATPGTPFNPNLHEAISMDDSEGDVEVIAEELRAGYQLGDAVIRHSMVRVTKQVSEKADGNGE